MFVRLNERNLLTVRNLVAGIFGLEEVAKQRLSTLLEYLDNDTFQGKLSQGKQVAQELVSAMDDLELIKDEPTGEGSPWFAHKKIQGEMAESVFDLFKPLIQLVEDTIRGQIAGSRSTVTSERSLIIIREKMIGALNLVREALPREMREAMPCQTFYPYDGVEEIRRHTDDMVNMLRDLAKQMTAFADHNASQLVKGAALRSQARTIKQDAEVWNTWRNGQGQNYWLLPDNEVIERTRGHLQAHLWATKKETASLPEDRSKDAHPETAYSLDQTEARIEEFLELLPNAEADVSAAVA